MTQNELIAEISKRSGVDKKTALLVYNTMVNVIKEKLLFGINVNLYGFLTFNIHTLKARKIKSPQSDKVLDIPKRYKVRVKLPQVFQKEMASKPVY